MDCFYCDLIISSDPDYVAIPAAYDLGSPGPRCAVHWRYVCGQCQRPSHFMAMSYCTTQRAYYCSRCASATQRVDQPFYVWGYYFKYRSPWTGGWNPSLDRLEFEGRHPRQTAHDADEPDSAVSPEAFYPRYPAKSSQRSAARPLRENDVQVLWDTNARRWNDEFDADGDEHRKYHSDSHLLKLVGRVTDREVLDVGCGNGYLCRKLALKGARVTGVEPSEEMIAIAKKHRLVGNVHIDYVKASATDLSALADESFDIVLFNHVLTSIGDHLAALNEARRVLRSTGHVVVVISHPCFSCGPRRWEAPAADTPRPEDVSAFRVDNYFATGSNLLDDWDGFSPVPYFHRPLRDYWHSFRAAGFAIDEFDEPTLNERGQRELPAWKARQAERIPLSCVFRLSKRTQEYSGSPGE